MTDDINDAKRVVLAWAFRLEINDQRLADDEIEYVCGLILEARNGDALFRAMAEVLTLVIEPVPDNADPAARLAYEARCKAQLAKLEHFFCDRVLPYL